MKKYLNTLLDDIAEAKNNRPTKRKMKEDEILPFELDNFMENSFEEKQKPIKRTGNIREIMGFEPEQFPPADYWTTDEAALLVKALNALLGHYNLVADYPTTLPPHLAYTTLVGALEKHAPIMPFGEWHLEFCQYDPTECPFGAPYCRCGNWEKEDKKEDKKEDSDSYDPDNNIAGIHNYCDAWCERCPFTDRCAVANDFENEKPDSGNRYTLGLWKDHNESFEKAKIWLQNQTKDNPVSLKPLQAEKQIFDKEENEVRRDVDSVAVIQLAKRYQDKVSKWLKLDRHKPLNDIIQNPSNTIFTEQGEAMIEQFMVIQWYEHHIYVKFIRAVRGKIEDESFGDNGDFPKDSDGSAKIALIGAERSATAWYQWALLYPEDKVVAVQMMVLLDAIIKAGEEECPDARNFIRPGFDELRETQK